MKEVDSLALVNKSCTIEDINKIRIYYSITSDDHGIKDRDELNPKVHVFSISL
ncbi:MULTISPECIES: hypothetical protein [Clostridium]|uniref:hypothetical protein n=1 Tax=Clostridium TaxID=1485 RepID=UPI001319BB90|nr:MULTISPECIES: hypothetical protein [Clostridium]